jgi:hypothetical protein
MNVAYAIVQTESVWQETKVVAGSVRLQDSKASNAQLIDQRGNRALSHRRPHLIFW